jgi:hypothetical protein
VVYTTDISVNDKSDAVFTVLPAGTNSVPDVAVTGSGIQVLGNYPNPFASTTTLRWVQGMAGDVSIRLYDGSGRVVGQYEAGRREAGGQQMTMASGTLPSGLYQYEVRSGNAVARGMMMIVR